MQSKMFHTKQKALIDFELFFGKLTLSGRERVIANC